MMNSKANSDLITRAKKIKCLICDIDGVLTKGEIFIDNNGNDMRVFYAQDGTGLEMLMAAGIKLAVITSSENNVIHQRMKQIGIDTYFTGQTNKRGAYQRIKEEFKFHDEEIAYIGDDLTDLCIIKQVGLGVAVPNAVSQVIDRAHLMTQKKGGEGAVRELCEFILFAQDKFDSALEFYLA
jgi:3-deoxy-D-manno-octulosonate 8-phosphate phosphatase (KDO 8-P phosphatase)